MRFVLAAVTLLVLAGCSSPAPSLSSDQAIDRYQPLFDDVSAAVEEGYPDLGYSVDSVHDLVDGDECTLWIGRLQNDSTDADDRADYVALIAPLAADAGFGTLTELDAPEGAPYEPAYLAHDETGASLRVSFTSPGLSISMTTHVNDQPCAD